MLVTEFSSGAPIDSSIIHLYGLCTDIVDNVETKTKKVIGYGRHLLQKRIQIYEINQIILVFNTV
mgnify:CR=1 FL=1